MYQVKKLRKLYNFQFGQQIESKDGDLTVFVVVKYRAKQV